jgi:hypothetical protein
LCPEAGCHQKLARAVGPATPENRKLTRDETVVAVQFAGFFFLGCLDDSD